jgi:hypothetical protein
MGSVSSLNPYQFAYNGFVFGAGTPWIVDNVDGLASLPPLRVQDDNRGYIDGSYSGRDFYDGRTVTIDMVIIGDSNHNAQYYYKQLQTNLMPLQLGTPSQLQVFGLFQFQLVAESLLGDSTVTGLKRMYGRVRKISTPIDPDYTYGYITTQVEFFFPDPRYYDDTQKNVSGSSVSLVNNGTATTCPYITITTTPATFTISDGTYNMLFSTSSSAPTTIDLLQRVIGQGSSSARNIFVSGYYWLNVPAQTTVTWTMSTGSMQIGYRNAYL